MKEPRIKGNQPPSGIFVVNASKNASFTQKIITHPIPAISIFQCQISFAKRYINIVVIIIVVETETP